MKSTLNEGRSISSGDTGRSAGRWRRWCSALNEGRSISSGDTAWRLRLHRAWRLAQRRPEHKLRRHVDLVVDNMSRADAQRRPEHKLRRHRKSSTNAQTTPPSLNEGRSISSGDTSPVESNPPGFRSAQRRPEHKLRRHQHYCGTVQRHWRPLNEGRSISSGDTQPRADDEFRRAHRSTKAGA